MWAAHWLLVFRQRPHTATAPTTKLLRFSASSHSVIFPVSYHQPTPFFYFNSTKSAEKKQLRHSSWISKTGYFMLVLGSESVCSNSDRISRWWAHRATWNQQPPPATARWRSKLLLLDSGLRVRDTMKRYWAIIDSVLHLSIDDLLSGFAKQVPIAAVAAVLNSVQPKFTHLTEATLALYRLFYNLIRLRRRRLWEWR